MGSVFHLFETALTHPVETALGYPVVAVRRVKGTYGHTLRIWTGGVLGMLCVCAFGTDGRMGGWVGGWVDGALT